MNKASLIAAATWFAAATTVNAQTTAPTPPSENSTIDQAQIDQGKVTFAQKCSHCHGPDAVQSVRKIDLRLLHHRYGDNTQTVFHDTVTQMQALRRAKCRRREPLELRMQTTVHPAQCFSPAWRYSSPSELRLKA